MSFSGNITKIIPTVPREKMRRILLTSSFLVSRMRTPAAHLALPACSQMQVPRHALRVLSTPLLKVQALPHVLHAVPVNTHTPNQLLALPKLPAKLPITKFYMVHAQVERELVLLLSCNPKSVTVQE